MKYVYVLTSSETDDYYEQFLLSVTSFRIYNPDDFIVLLVDEKTKSSLTQKRNSYKTLITNEIVISVPKEYTQKEASRWIKTSINKYVEGSFFFIDCDTIIAEKLDCNFDNNISIGAVADCHLPLYRHHLLKNFQKEDALVGFCSSLNRSPLAGVSELNSDLRYNGGIIYCSGSAAAINFFNKWHLLWKTSAKRGCSQDMPALNQANYELQNIITPLGGEWNCQISHNGLRFLCCAKIIHYYATSLISFEHPFLLADKNVFLALKETGTVPEKQIYYLKNAKKSFSDKVRILSDETALDVLESAFFSKLLWLRRRHKKIFFCADNFVNKIRKPKHLHIAKKYQ